MGRSPTWFLVLLVWVLAGIGVAAIGSIVLRGKAYSTNSSAATIATVNTPPGSFGRSTLTS